MARLGMAVGDIHGGLLPFPKHGLYRAAKGQPSLCSRLDPEGLGLAAALLILGDPLTR